MRAVFPVIGTLSETGAVSRRSQSGPASARRSTRLLLSCCAIFAVPFTAGCGGTAASPTTMPTPTPPRPADGDDTVFFASLDPPAGSLLRSGQVVVFTANIGYKLATNSSATVSLEVLDQASRPVQVVGMPGNASVSAGSGQITLTHSVSLPASGVSRVTLYCFLAAGPNRVMSISTAAFPVE